MLLSRTEWVLVETANQTFPISYDYLEEEHISVVQGATPNPATETPYIGGINFIDKQNATLTDAPLGSYVQFRRNTPKDETLLQFVQTNPVLPQDVKFLNDSAFFSLQELCDVVGLFSGTILPPSLNNFYELQLGGTFDGIDAGPLVIGRACTLTAGSTFRAAVVTNPSDTQTLGILRNGSPVGSIEVTDAGVVSLIVPSPVSLALGDSVIITQGTDQGLRNFGIVIILERTT